MSTPPRVVICGTTGVGKTVFGQRLRTDKYVPVTHMTVGGQAFDLEIGDVVVSFWDTAGQERYLSLAPNYFRNAVVVIFAYSIDSRESLEALNKFQAIFEQTVTKGVKTVAVGLKRDREAEGKREVPFDTAEAYVKTAISPRPEFLIEVSSMTGEGIEGFKSLLKDVVQNVDRSAEPKTVVIKREKRARCC
jgi:small GTP-binding protein